MKLRNPDPAAAATADSSPVSMTRRFLARRRIETIVFVSLGTDGTGTPKDSRENGTVSREIGRLTLDQTLHVVFKLAGIDGWLRATGRVAWLSDTGKAAGLKFLDMPDESAHLVDQWLAKREQSRRLISISGSPVEPPAGLASALPNFDLDSYQVALPVEAIEIVPEPLPSGREVATAAVPSSVRKEPPKIETNSAKGLWIRQARDSETLPEPAPVRYPLEDLKNDRRVVRSFALTIGALAAMFAIAGVIVWQIRDGSLLRLVSAQPMQPNVPTANATAVQAQIDASFGPAEAGLGEFGTAPLPKQRTLSAMPTPSADRWGKLEKQEVPKKAVIAASPFAPTSPATSATHPLASRPAPAQQIVRSSPTRAPSTKVLPPVDARPLIAGPPAATAVLRTPAAPPISAPPNSISEHPIAPPAPAPAAEKPTIPAATPLNSDTQTGSIEVVSDPYPSIRMPAGQKSGSRPAALTIGRLVSKAEPVYPADALRQRISGTVKLHVVLGIDGRVETALVIEGPVQLRDAALHAVEQWRYEPTLLGSTPVEAEQDVSLVFRVTASSHLSN